MSSEKRLHPVAMLVGAITTLRRWVSGLVFPGVVLLVSQGFSLWTVTLFLLGLIVVAALAALWGFLSWRATTYAVAGNSFRLRQGVFQRNERTIPLEHVQSVDTVQGIIQRAVGVVEVRIETAGGGASEPDASLAALDRDAAQTLRREIEGPKGERSEKTAGPTVLRRLSTRDLLLAGATSGQIGVAFSVLAIGFQFLDNFFPEDFVRRLAVTLAPNWLMVVLILVPAGLLLAWLLAIAGTVLAYSGFTLFPLLPGNEVEELLADAAPEFASAPVIEPLPRRSLRRYVFRATFLYMIIAFAAALVSFLVFQSALGLLGLFLIPSAAAYGWLCYRDAGWAFEEDRLVVRHRSLGRKTAIAPRLHLQSRGMVSSPFQRRVRLATFLAEVASGSGGSVLPVKDLDGGAAETLGGDLGAEVRLEGA